MLCGDLNRLNVDAICSACSLRNLHDQPTYGAAQLDYILISEKAASSYTIVQEVPIDESSVPHLSLLALPTSSVKSSMTISHAVYDLRSSHVNRFINQLEFVDWCFTKDATLSLDAKCWMFHVHLQHTFEACIPVTYVTFTNDTKPWITPVVKKLINERWKAYREKNFALYNHLKTKVKYEMKKSKMIWAQKLKGQNVWSVVKEIRNQKTGDSMKSLYYKFGTIQTAAEVINHKLVEVFSKKDIDVKRLSVSEQTEVHISESYVYSLLKNLPNHKASPDLPTKLYKKAAHVLAGPLASIFSQSIKEASVPAAWKMSTVIPIPKTSKPSSTDDVRPISLIPLPAKLLERVVLDFAKPYFLKNYGDDQFGFRPKSSTTCALICLHDHITKCLEMQNVMGVQVISYDFSKAFDKLRHDIIVKRLIECGLPESLICWISSYLDNRFQCVKIGSSQSSFREASSGVPQGSVLGPFLFSVVMGSLKIEDADCCMVKYADDVTLSVPVYKNSTNSHVAEVHESIKDWSLRFGLPLNEKKCKCLGIPRSAAFNCVSLDNVIQVETLSLLGVTFNEKCTWTHHIKCVTKKASRRLFPLRLLRPLLDDGKLKTVYFGLMRSILEYASPLLIGMTQRDANCLSRLQKRFHRLLCGKQCQKECLQPLEERRLEQSLALYHSILKEDHILNKLACKQSTTGRLLLPSVTTTRRLNSFTLKAAISYNQQLQR